MVAYDGITFVAKPRLIKLVQAIADDDMAKLYTTLRGADTHLRNGFIRLLLNNPFPGADKALSYLADAEDPLTACRAAAVCLLVHKPKGT